MAKDIVAAVVWRKERLLVMRPSSGSEREFWSFPRGPVREGETPPDALRRILESTLGLTVNHIGKLLLTFRETGRADPVHFWNVVATGDPDPSEELELRWRTPTELLEHHRLAPAESLYVQELPQTPR